MWPLNVPERRVKIGCNNVGKRPVDERSQLMGVRVRRHHGLIDDQVNGCPLTLGRDCGLSSRPGWMGLLWYWPRILPPGRDGLAIHSATAEGTGSWPGLQHNLLFLPVSGHVFGSWDPFSQTCLVLRVRPRLRPRLPVQVGRFVVPGATPARAPATATAAVATATVLRLDLRRRLDRDCGDGGPRGRL